MDQAPCNNERSRFPLCHLVLQEGVITFFFFQIPIQNAQVITSSRKSLIHQGKRAKSFLEIWDLSKRFSALRFDTILSASMICFVRAHKAQRNSNSAWLFASPFFSFGLNMPQQHDAPKGTASSQVAEGRRSHLEQFLLWDYNETCQRTEGLIQAAQVENHFLKCSLQMTVFYITEKYTPSSITLAGLDPFCPFVRSWREPISKERSGWPFRRLRLPTTQQWLCDAISFKVTGDPVSK